MVQMIGFSRGLNNVVGVEFSRTRSSIFMMRIIIPNPVSC